MRIIIKFLLSALLVFSLLCFSAWAYLNSNYAKPQVAEAIGNSLSKFTGSNITIGGVSFSFPGTLSVNDITLSEASSPWLYAKKVYISFSPSEILQGKIVIKSLELDDVNLINLPSSSETENTFSFNSINLSTSLPLELEQIKINHAILSSNVIAKLHLFPDLSKELQFYATIVPDLSQGSISTTWLLGSSQDAKESLSKIELSLKQNDDAILAAFDISDNKAGLISELSKSALPDNLHLHGNATLSLQNLQALIDTLPESGKKTSAKSCFSISLGKDIQGKGEMNLFSDRALHLYIEEGYYGPLNLEGNIFLSPQQNLDGTKLNISLNDITLLESWLNHPLDSLHGSIQATLALRNSLEGLQALVEFKSNEISYKTKRLNTINGKLDINRKIDAWDGQIQLTAISENIPIDLSAQYDWKSSKLIAFKNLSLLSDSSSLEGALSYEQNSDWFEGEVKGATSLSFWDKWLPEPIDGEVFFKARFLHSTTPSLELQIESPKLISHNTILNDFSLIASLSDVFNIPILTSAPTEFHGQIYSSVGQLIRDDLKLNNLSFATTINDQEKEWPFVLSLGESSKDANLIDVEGNWFFRNKYFRLFIDHLDGKVSDIPLALAQSIELNFKSLDWDITPITLKWGDSLIKTSLSYKGSQLNSSIQFEKIPLHALRINPSSLPVQGSMSGWTKVNGPLNAPKINSEISLKDIKINEYDIAKAPPFSGLFQVNLDETGLKCVGNAQPLENSPLHLETQLPVIFSIYPFALNIDKTAPISGNANISGEIQTILQLFFKDTINLSGPVNAKAVVNGTLEAPLINGIVIVENGLFEIPEIGTEMRNVSAYFESSGKEVILKKLTASDKRGGSLNGTGRLLLDQADQFPYQIDFSVNNTTILDQDFAKGSFTGNLVFKGNAAGATLTGTATADSITISIPEQASALINSVEVTYINQPESEKTLTIEKSPAWPLILDLNVSAPENVSVRGKELRSEWKGNLAIHGPTTNLEFTGSFKVVKGQYLFNGKDFDINQGSINLNGPLEGKATTTLYVIASKDLGKVKAEVIVKGPVSNPEISFRSNPPLPQREILSWLLFGRGTSEISPFQGSQLSESITNLKSNNKGPDVLTKVRNRLGIDRLDITRDENNDNAVSIQVGKYISKNVFVSVNKSNVNRIAVEAALMPNIKLQAQVGDDSEGQILLKWKHDY